VGISSGLMWRSFKPVVKVIIVTVVAIVAVFVAAGCLPHLVRVTWC
jgi:hypothetical protein